MKTELEVQKELKAVRATLAAYRRDGAPGNILTPLWYAQQALLWVLDRGASITQTIDLTEKIADEIED